MSVAAPKMPASNSALQSIHLFGPHDILLKIKLSMKNIQKSHESYTRHLLRWSYKLLKYFRNSFDIADTIKQVGE